jgi:tungstate transport system substrate-binding protein
VIRHFVTVFCAALLMCGCVSDSAERPRLDIATTTSVVNSGLLDALLPHYADAIVRVHAAGSGRSLEMLNDGVVDLIISHAPDAELRYVQRHAEWVYRKLAYNQFVIVGPPHDPARVRQANDALDAFRKIASSPVTFVSRGDSSGTHEREQSLWRAAGTAPDPVRLLVSGQGMAITLRQTHERHGYTLADEATFWQLESQLDLKILFSGDQRLLNTYAVVYSPTESARLFAEWLAQGEGRKQIQNYKIGGRAVFIPWPVRCDGARPTAQPCG